MTIDIKKLRSFYETECKKIDRSDLEGLWRYVALVITTMSNALEVIESQQEQLDDKM